jgi:hypothetical protein
MAAAESLIPLIPYAAVLIVFAIIMRITGTHIHDLIRVTMEEVRSLLGMKANLLSINLLGVIMIFIIVVLILAHGSIEFIYGRIAPTHEDQLFSGNALHATLVLLLAVSFLISMKLAKK